MNANSAILESNDSKMKSFFQSDQFKGLAIFSIIIAGFGLLAYNPATSSKDIPVEGEGAEAPVLLELFTSEGCHSCPPAEKLVNQMIEQDVVLGADVIALQYHVDYWNYLGWEDPYSDPIHTERQKAYAIAFRNSSVYTPQMVVDGQTEFVGSDAGKALDVIDVAKRISKIDMIVSNKFDGEKISLDISSEETISENEDYHIYAAVVENNLEQEITSGENRGKTLQHHGVVRSFHDLGKIQSNQKINVQAGIKVPTSINTENTSTVVFIQHPETKHVASVAQVSLTK